MVYASMRHSDSNCSLRAPLLDPFAPEAQQPFNPAEKSLWSSANRLRKDLAQQLALAGPLAINLVAANAAAVVNLFFVARCGTNQLAAAALGNNVAVMLGRLVLLGLCGALDTLAAQAWGAGKEARLPLLLQRAVLFLWAHCLPLSGAMLLLPRALVAVGCDPGLAGMLRSYLLALLPSVWLEAVSRPITRVLVAGGTATPQMLIALLGLPLNIATNYYLVVVAGWQYIGAAAAMAAAAGYDLLLLLAYVALSGKWTCVIGCPSRRGLRGWRPLALLAYPSAAMKCAESWAFTICTLAAALLPNACTATAAVGVSYNVYGVFFITFVAASTAACVTVGNRLGAGDARGAKLSAAVSLLVVPLAWGLAAAVLLAPAGQATLIKLFLGPGDTSGGGGGGAGDDGELRGVLGRMFVIVAGLVLLDGVQTILSGVIQGCGRQQAGALVNLVAFYGVALPLAGLLAFRLPLPAGLPGGGGGGGDGGRSVGLGLGAEGLYLGMAAGPAIQTVCYAIILLRTNWEAAAQQAATNGLLLRSSSSIASLLRRTDPGMLVGPLFVRTASAGSGVGSGMGSPRVGSPRVGGTLSNAFSTGLPWLLPVISERVGEGRDSMEGFGNGSGGGGSGGGQGSGGGSSVRLWLRAASGEEGDGSGSGGGGGSGSGGDEGAEEEEEDEVAERMVGVWVGVGLGVEVTKAEIEHWAREGGHDGGGANAAIPDKTLPPRPPSSTTAAAVTQPSAPFLTAPSPLRVVVRANAVPESAKVATTVCNSPSPPSPLSPHSLVAPPHWALAASIAPDSPVLKSVAISTTEKPHVGSYADSTSPSLSESSLARPYATHQPASTPGPAVAVVVAVPAALPADSAVAAAGTSRARWASAARWLWYGWGRSSRAAAAVTAGDAAIARVAEDVRSATEGMLYKEVPLQLPGLDITTGTVTAATAAATTAMGHTAPLPITAAAAAAAGPQRNRSRPLAYSDEELPVDSSVPHSSAVSSGEAARTSGEDFQSCRSLVVGPPGSADINASSLSGGTDGGCWLDVETSGSGMNHGTAGDVMIM